MIPVFARTTDAARCDAIVTPTLGFFVMRMTAVLLLSTLLAGQTSHDALVRS